MKFSYKQTIIYLPISLHRKRYKTVRVNGPRTRKS